MHLFTYIIVSISSVSSVCVCVCVCVLSVCILSVSVNYGVTVFTCGWKKCVFVLLELDPLVWCKEDQVVQVEDRLVECPPVDQIALRYDSEDIMPVNYIPPPCEFIKKRMEWPNRLCYHTSQLMILTTKWKWHTETFSYNYV